MIAKGKAIAHGANAIRYAMRKDKIGQVVGSSLLGSINPADMVAEFEMVNRYNERCKNKYLRFEIGIAPGDEGKLTASDLSRIVRAFTCKMKLERHQ